MPTAGPEVGGPILEVGMAETAPLNGGPSVREATPATAPELGGPSDTSYTEICGKRSRIVPGATLLAPIFQITV